MYLQYVGGQGWSDGRSNIAMLKQIAQGGQKPKLVIEEVL
jgi:hypothetical protein